MSPLVSEQRIDLPYTYTAGPMQRAALVALGEGRIVGSAGGGVVAAPARPFAADGTPLTETVDLPDRGVLVAVTVARHLPGEPAFGLIRLDGATVPLLHHLGDGAEELGPGDAVQAVWRDERSGAITDISHFRPA